MKKAKFIFTMIFTLLTGMIAGALITYFIMANPKKISFPQRHANKIQKLTAELGLNSKQKKQFYAIHLRYLDKGCVQLQQTRPLMLRLMQEEAKEINSILTPDQQEKYNQITLDRIEKFKIRFANAKLLKEQLPKQ